MNWTDCDNEVKMYDFFERLDDKFNLRVFAVDMADSIRHLLTDQRLNEAISVADKFFKKKCDDIDIAAVYEEVQDILEEIEDGLPDDLDDWNDDFEELLNAGQVVAWALLPPKLYGDKRKLEIARESALHTAFYCFKIAPSTEELRRQERVMRSLGLI